MPTIVIKTQAELDALPDSFKEFTVIEIRGGTQYDRIIVKKARESSHVEARESSHVVAWGSSHVVAWGSSHVEARESSHVVARESSHVEAWGSSHVVAWGSSHVVAWGSSHVVARGSSHVVARGSCAVHNQSENTTLEIGGFVVAWLLAKAKSIKKIGKNCRTVTPKRKSGTSGWIEEEGLKILKSRVILFKRVSSDFKTQEVTPNETLWEVGSTVEHPSWSPTAQECGPGKYHACSHGYFCDEFRSTVGDRYVAIEVDVKDMHAWDRGSYPHKVAFRKGVVLHECDKYGVKKA